MTQGQRRTWLALEEQKRRRNRASGSAQPVPAILLGSDGHGHLTWTLNFTSPYDQISIYQSADGVNWGTDTFDGWDLAAGNRDCSGSAGYFRICISDYDGHDVLPYSNSVYSDGLSGQAVNIVLSSDGHGHLTWTCNVSADFGFTIGHSPDGNTWDDLYDNANPGQFVGNEGGDPGYFRVALLDGDGHIVLPYSNVVYSDGVNPD